MYSISLNSQSCIFDDGEFETLEQAVEFARGRGGKYSVNISSGDPFGKYNMVHLVYDSNSDFFSLDTGWGFTKLPNENLVETLNNYV